ITSADGANAGVVFFPRGQGPAVRDHLGGKGADPPPGAYVLQIEVGLIDPLGRYEVQWSRDLMPLEGWGATRPLNPLRKETEPSPARGPAVMANGLVTGDAYAFFGYPYPTTSPTGPYSGSCLPVMSGVGVDVHSPVALLVKDAQNRGLGFDASGAYQNDL